jgi:hypothetical protein
MALTHLAFNDQLSHGRLLRQALLQLESGLEALNDIIAVMAVMLDGDGSSTTHFPYITSHFGFSTDANAKLAYEELNSLAGKLNTDASTTNVHAAMLQAFSKFR